MTRSFCAPGKISFWIVLLLFALLVCSPQAALAQITMNAIPLGYRANAPYCYYRLILNNPMGQVLGYTLTIQGDYSDKRAIEIRRQTLPPGGEKILNLAIPLAKNPLFIVRDSEGGRNTTAQNRGERFFLQIDDMANWAPEKDMQAFTAAYIAPPPPPGSQPAPSGSVANAPGMTPEAVQQMMQMQALGMLPPGMQVPTAAQNPLTTHPLFAVPPPSGPPPTPIPSMPVPPFIPPGVIPPAGANNLISQLEPAGLPQNWLCYTPFKAIFIAEAAFGRLDPSQKGALLKWVRSGGDLNIYGSEREEDLPTMLGFIRYQKENPLAHAQVRSEWRQDRPALERYYQSEPPGDPANAFLYDSEERGGRLGGLALATAFCILAGPVSHFYLKKKNQLRRLIIYLPVISIGFCLLIIIYFVAAQGFAKKGGSFGITILDEGSDAAFTFTRHSFFSGLYPLGGFEFDQETAVYPLQQWRNPNEQNFSFDLTNRQKLESGLFSPSFNFHYFTAFPSITRERLIYDPVAKTVGNGFEKALEGVIIYSGSEMYGAQNIAPGERKPLRSLAGSAAAEDFLRDLLRSEELEFMSRMDTFYQPVLQSAGVRYFARMQGESSWLQSGIKMHSPNICNLLVGRLEAK